MTLREWIAKGEAQLRAGPHPERARRDAETLLLHCTGKSRAWLMAHADEDLAECAAIGYATLLNRRCKGEPIQYIIGETEFFGLLFHVTGDVLIPRPETEHVVEKAIELAAAFAQPRIADVGAGSGAIAASLAHQLHSARITAIDCSLAALAVALENAERNGVAERVRFLEGDLLTPVAEERFELVVSNPPYVPTNDRDSLPIEVREYEPELALFAGADGLDVYRRLIPMAYALLVCGGFLVLEIGYGQQTAIHALLEAAGYVEIGFAADLQGIPRVAFARRR